jgi:hypothetical protein
MVEITSGKGLEDWLKDKPVDWAQILAMRIALRIFPYSFGILTPKEAVKNFSLPLIRAASMSWIMHNFSGYDVTTSMHRAANAARIASSHNNDDSLRFDVVETIALSARAQFIFDSSYDIDSTTILEYANRASFYDSSAITRAYFARFAEFVSSRGLNANVSAMWHNISKDCQVLISSSKLASEAHILASTTSWLNEKPKGWWAAWGDAVRELRDLDQGYDVWIDWYNRRIEGHDAAFDIPGDVDRIHDKAILARLADATNKDFWDKGATYVNTTLQSWIDDARIEARIEEIKRKLRAGATTHYGLPDDLAERAALEDEIDRLLSLTERARLGIGGNHPPEPIDFAEQAKGLPQEMREPLVAISTELKKREPDELFVMEQVKLLHRVGRKLEKMASLASDEFAKSVGGELGKRVVQGAFWIVLINQILNWLAPLIR